MELLVGIALDPDTIQTLEKSNGTVQSFAYFIAFMIYTFAQKLHIIQDECAWHGLNAGSAYRFLF